MFALRASDFAVGTMLRVWDRVSSRMKILPYQKEVLCRVFQHLRMCKIYLTYQELCFFIAYLKVL